MKKILLGTFLFIILFSGVGWCDIAPYLDFQGKIAGGDIPAEGSIAKDIIFKIYDAAAGGTQIGPTITLRAVPIEKGIFSVKIPVAAEIPFDKEYWMEITVGASSLGRQQLTAAPYAFTAKSIIAEGGNSRVLLDTTQRTAISAKSTDYYGTGVRGEGGDYGVYGKNAWDVYGYLGGKEYAVQGIYGAGGGISNGYLGSVQYGAYGRGPIGVYGTDGIRWGSLGSGNYGAYGQYTDDIYGYLGYYDSGATMAYGVYGQGGRGVYGTSGPGRPYGFLGSGSYGAYGAYDGDHYGTLGGAHSGGSFRAGSETATELKYGVFSIAHSGKDVYGVYGNANKYGSESKPCYGLYGWARGDTGNPGALFGVYGTVSGVGSPKFAGYFTGGDGLYASRLVLGSINPQDYNVIGNKVTTHGLSSNYDLLITGKLEVDSSLYLDSEASGTGTALYLTADNQIVKLTSSRRFKKDIEPLAVSYEKFMALQPVKFRWNEQSQTPNVEDYGLIAEEAEKIAPELVIYNESGQPQSISYQKINTLLLKVVQEQQKRIEKLENEVKILEER
jgi:hypothetical protein